LKTLDEAEEYELWGYPDTTIVDCDLNRRSKHTAVISRKYWT